jgi:ATP-dependent Clp protease adaptor protein ClpS
MQLLMATHEITQPLEEQVVKEEEQHKLILWNDEVNTFDWVIDCLVEVCEHTAEQAEQCAYFVHYKGKYAVKLGSFDDLKPRCEALHDRGLNATVD